MRRIVGYVGPGLALQELLYGFIMALLFVTAAQLGIVKDAISAIVLIVGMNFTWGAIDMIVFTVVDRFNQRKYIRLVAGKDSAENGRYVERLIEDELAGTLIDVVDREDEKKIVELIMASRLEPEEELLRSIGENIRRLRHERGLTLKQLGRRASLSVSLLSQIERAESSASISSLYRVATALDTRISDLFGDF